MWYILILMPNYKKYQKCQIHIFIYRTYSLSHFSTQTITKQINKMFNEKISKIKIRKQHGVVFICAIHVSRREFICRKFSNKFGPI